MVNLSDTGFQIWCLEHWWNQRFNYFTVYFLLFHFISETKYRFPPTCTKVDSFPQQYYSRNRCLVHTLLTMHGLHQKNGDGCIPWPHESFLKFPLRSWPKSDKNSFFRKKCNVVSLPPTPPDRWQLSWPSHEKGIFTLVNTGSAPLAVCRRADDSESQKSRVAGPLGGSLWIPP